MKIRNLKQLLLLQSELLLYSGKGGIFWLFRVTRSEVHGEEIISKCSVNFWHVKQNWNILMQMQCKDFSSSHYLPERFV